MRLLPLSVCFAVGLAGCNRKGLSSEQLAATRSQALLQVAPKLAALKRVALAQLPTGSSPCRLRPEQLPRVVVDDLTLSGLNERGIPEQRVTATPAYRSLQSLELLNALAGPDQRDRDWDPSLDTQAAVADFAANPLVAMLVPRRFEPPLMTEKAVFTQGELVADLYILDLAGSTVRCHSPVTARSSATVSVSNLGGISARQKPVDQDFRANGEKALAAALTALAAPGGTEAPVPLPIQP